MFKAWFLISSIDGVETDPTIGSSFEHSILVITDRAVVVLDKVESLNSVIALTTLLTAPTEALTLLAVFSR